MENTVWSYLHVESKKVELIEAESRMVVGRGWGMGDMGWWKGIKSQL